MSNISKPPPLLVVEDSIEKSTAKRPVSKLTQLKEAPDPAEKKSRAKKEKPLSRAERRKLEKEREAEEESLKIVIPGGNVPAPAAIIPTPEEEPVVEEAPVEEEPEIPAEEMFTEEEPATEENVETDEVRMEELFKDSNNPTTDETRIVAAHPDLDPAHLAEFAKSDVEKIRAAVASNPSTDVKTLTKLKKDKSEAVIVALIGNENFPAKLLPGFVGRAKKEEAVLHALAGREDAPPKLAKVLLKLLPASE